MRTRTHSTKSIITGRAAAAVAVTAFAGLVTVAPAQAKQDPGTGSTGVSPADVRVWENSQDQGNGSSGSGVKPGPVQFLPTDDNAIEYLQVALGALGGFAVVGAIVAGSARRHGHAHPA